MKTLVLALCACAGAFWAPRPAARVPGARRVATTPAAEDAAEGRQVFVQNIPSLDGAGDEVNLAVAVDAVRAAMQAQFGEVERVGEPPRIRPVGLVDRVLHHVGVEVTERESVEGHDSETAVEQAIPKVLRAARPAEFAGGRGGKPESESERGVGVLVAMTGRTKLALLGSVAAGAAAALTLSKRRADDTADDGTLAAKRKCRRATSRRHGVPR